MWFLTLLWYLLIIFIVFILIIKAYIKLRTAWCRSNVCMVGKTAIITGANAGIGYETALEFAKRGGTVILACRDEGRGNEARRKIIEETGNPNISVEILNLNSLQSVRDFAKKINSTVSKLDILLNNAGIIGSGKPETTEDGLDLVMQSNYFGHVLLTHLLLDLLKKSGSSRIINVSSEAANHANVDLKDVNSYDGSMMQYPKSKLCNILFTLKLARELKTTQVTTYSAHPGAVYTYIFKTGPKWLQPLFQLPMNYLLKTSVEGAQTLIYCSLQKDIEKYSGEHFVECDVVPRYKTVKDSKQIDDVWKETRRILQIE